MKMKKACEATGLTERAIRLYIKKELISPGQTNGILDFTARDIGLLQDIAALRQAEFSIEEILLMLRGAAEIRHVLSARAERAQARAESEARIRETLCRMEADCPESVHALAVRIRSGGQTELGEPDFGRFDEIGIEQRRREREEAIGALPWMERQGRKQRAAVIMLCAFLVLAGAAALFLGQVRISGYLGVSPVVVKEIGEHGRISAVLAQGSHAAELIGREEICVSYRAYGSELRPGERIENGCTLAVELTNLDLMRLGISPLQRFQGRSSEMNEEWMRLILHALFCKEEPEGAVLWIREISGLRPLIPWAE